MDSKALFMLLLSSLLTLFKVHAIESKVIKFAAVERCPYVCSDPNVGKGIIFDYVEKMLAPHGFVVEQYIYPPSRAALEVKTGNMDGLFHAVVDEAPDLAFTNERAMHYKMCFFKKVNNDWHYDGIDSLKNIKLAVIHGGKYEKKLDAFLTAQKDKIHWLFGKTNIERLIKVVVMNRVDVLLADTVVVSWYQQREQQEKIVKAGCLDHKPFYFAFNKSFAQNNGIISLLNNELAIKSVSLIEAVFPKYFPDG